MSEPETVSLPDSPYKGLAAFADSAGDAAFFFGRERERETIVANLLADRVTVLYGPSGVGKSSLLRAGVAQQLRHLPEGIVVVHGTWTDDPVASLVGGIAEAVAGLGPTAGLADAVAAATANGGELFLLFDQFEEYFLYHGADGPLSVELPELLNRRGLRVNVLIALRDDALSELDAFTDRLPALFANLLRLDRLDRNAGREAIVSPLARYSELAGVEYRVEPELVEAILDEVAAGRVDFSGAGETGRSDTDIEAPFLQLVLERLWAEEQALQSVTLRLETFRRLGGAEPIVREHAQGALERLPAEQQGEAARVVRQLVTPSGTKIAHTASDLAEYADVAPGELQPLLDTLARERIVRGVDGTPGRPTRYEIFHDILAAPVLAWRVDYEVEREKLASARQRKRLRAIVAAAVVALVVVGTIAVYAFVQRSDARTAARQAHGRELAADALAGIPTDPAASTALALLAAKLAPGPQSENVLRSSLLALRETRVIPLGGEVVGASFAPRGGLLLIASSKGRAALYSAGGRLFASLPRQGSLTRVAWSADGKLFALGYATGKATLWDVGGGQGGHPPLRTIRTSAPITALAFAGQSLLVASGGHLRLLPSPSARVRTIRVSGGITAAAISPNRRLIAFAAQRKGKVRASVLDLRTHHLRYTLDERGIDSLIFSADSRLLVTGSSDKTAHIWSAANGHLLHVLTMRGQVVSERFSSDGQWLVTASTDGTAAIWNVRTGQRNLLLSGSNGGADDAAFSPDGTEVAVAFADRTARIYSTQDGRLLAPLAGHGDAVTSVGYDPSGTLIVTGSADGTARLWQANPTGQLTTIDKRTSVGTALFADDDVVSVAGNEARVLTPTGAPIGRLRLPARITTEAADGNELVLADSRGDLVVEHLRSRARLLLRGPGIDALAFAPNGALLAGSTDGTVRIWKSIAGTPITVHVGRPVVEVVARAARFAVRTAQGQARIYSLSGDLISSIGEKAQRIALSPDGRMLATTRAREADLWDASTGRLLHRLTGQRSLVTDAEFSPDSQLLVTASDDHDGRLWDAATGQLLHVLRGHFFPVRSATFSPNGRWIVTASQFTGGLWDATTGQLVLYLQGHTAPLTSATFSSDGSWIVTGSYDNTTSVFRCDVCRNLVGLEEVARQRLAPLRK